MKAIYVIAEDGADVCKIGITGDPNRRVTILQTGCPKRLVLIGAWNAPDAERLEQALHAKFAPFRLVGEWFSISSAEAIFAIGHECGVRGIVAVRADVLFAERPFRPPVSPLQRWRLEQGHSLQDLAKLLSTTHGTLSRAERGVCRPQPALERRIVDLTGLSRDELASPHSAEACA